MFQKTVLLNYMTVYLSFLPPAAFVLFLLLKPETARVFIKSLRLSRALHYTVIFCLGFFLGIKKSSALWHINDLNDIAAIFSGVMAIVCLYCSSIILNNIYDSEIDAVNSKSNAMNSGVAGKPLHISAFIFFTAAGLAVPFFHSTLVFIVSVLILICSYIYSCPPFRIKKIFLLNTVLIAFSTVITIFFGFCWATAGNGQAFFNYRFAFACLVVLTLAFNVKDINDYQGDLKYGVRTVVTVLGQKKGRLITSLLAFMGYLMLPLFLGIYSMILPAVTAGLATYLIVNREKVNEGLVFTVFFVFAGMFAFIAGNAI